MSGFRFHGEATGDCFLVAYEIGTRFTPDELVDDIPRGDIRVVHGLPMDRGPQNEGRRYWHAWVEVTKRTTISEEVVIANPAFVHFGGEIVTELIVDRSNGGDLVLPKAVFYNIGQLDEDHIWRFTMQEAYREVSKRTHCGPWVDDYESYEEVEQ